MTLQIRIIDGDTIVDRDMNEQELAIHAASDKQIKAQAKAEAQRAALKEATLAKLGLTADEVAALLS